MHALLKVSNYDLWCFENLLSLFKTFIRYLKTKTPSQMFANIEQETNSVSMSKSVSASDLFCIFSLYIFSVTLLFMLKINRLKSFSETLNYLVFFSTSWKHTLPAQPLSSSSKLTPRRLQNNVSGWKLNDVC